MYGLKIRMRQFANRAIAFNKGVPKTRVAFARTKHKHGEMPRDRSQKSGTAIIQIEEHRLCGVGSLQCNVGVIPVAITVAVRPEKSIPFCQRARQSRCQINKPCAYGVARLRSPSANISDKVCAADTRSRVGGGPYRLRRSRQRHCIRAKVAPFALASAIELLARDGRPSA
jgi:hypothetical protein